MISKGLYFNFQWCFDRGNLVSFRLLISTLRNGFEGGSEGFCNLKKGGIIAQTHLFFGDIEPEKKQKFDNHFSPTWKKSEFAEPLSCHPQNHF